MPRACYQKAGIYAAITFVYSENTAPEFSNSIFAQIPLVVYRVIPYYLGWTVPILKMKSAGVDDQKFSRKRFGSLEWIHDGGREVSVIHLKAQSSSIRYTSGG